MRARVVVTLRFADAATARAVAELSERADGAAGPARSVRGRAVHFQAQGPSLSDVRARVDDFLAAASVAERARTAPARRRK